MIDAIVNKLSISCVGAMIHIEDTVRCGLETAVKTLQLYFILLIVSQLLWGIPVYTQDDGTCSNTAVEALRSADSVCVQIGANEACYGNTLVDATLRTITADQFDTPGEQIDLAEIDSLRLSRMNLENGTWGVAKLRIQSTTLDSQLEDITVLLFGDVNIDNDVFPRTILSGRIASASGAYVNLRDVPNFITPIIGSVPPDTIVSVLGRLSNSAWYRIQMDNPNRIGWIPAEYVIIDGDVEQLYVDDPNETYYGPMQAFAYASGTAVDQACGSSQVDGLLIQTPEGPAQVKLFINEVSIDLLPSEHGNTMFVRSQAGGEMTMDMLQGSAYVEAFGVGYTAVQGSRVSVALSNDLSPANVPSPPRPYNADEVAGLPLEALGDIQPAAPATVDTIIENSTAPWIRDVVEQPPTNTGTDETGTIVNADGTVTTTDGTTTTTDGGSGVTTEAPPPPPPADNPPPEDDGGRPDCPGGSCEAPGQNK